MATLIDGSAYGLMYTMIDAAVKASLLLALAAAIAVLSRRASASFRHLAWALGLGCALCLPLLSRNLPRWRVPITTPLTHSRPAAEEAPPADAPQPDAPQPDAPQPAPQAAASATPRAKAGVPSAPAPSSSAAAPMTAPTARPSPAPAPPIPWTVWALLIWAAGAGLVLAQLAQGLAMVRRIARTSVPVPAGPVAEAAEAAAETMRVGRPVALRQASAAGQVTMPFTYGARRPVLVLPAEAHGWPEKRLEAALLHEMAHVRRHDWPLQVMAHIARALYWFNPLAWLAARRLRAEAEAACDDLVLGAGVPAQDYARHLLDVALSARRSRRVGWGTVAMAQNPRVEGRLRAVLAQSLSRRPVTRRSAAGLLAAALLLALPLAALRLVAQAPGVPVPAADRLQLHGDFTLTYAVTIRNQQTTAMLLHEYQQLRQDYTRELAKDPFMQPVPEEFYLPFAAFQKRRTQTRRVVITVSSRAHSLLYQTVESNDTYAQLYDGHNTQAFGNGHAGPINPGRQLVMSECPLPAVGLPFTPLLKNTALVGSSGAHQTWQASIVDVGVAQGQGEAFYEDGLAHAVNDGGEWKLLDTDNTSQRWQFFQHQRFQGLWVASHMRLIKYDTDAPLPPKGKYRTLQAIAAWFRVVRKPSEVSEYRLLSAREVAFAPSTLVKRPHRGRSPGFFIAEDVFFQEALHLRYHLQNWAEAHKALLQNMENAASSDRSFVSSVSQSLRSLPFPLWQGDPRPSHIWGGDPRIGHDGQKPLFKAERPSAQGNSTFNDFEIARSLNPGVVHIVLWASGRITRATARGTTGSESQQEIVPAFFGSDGRGGLAAATSPTTGHPQDDATASGHLGPNTVQATAILTHPRSGMMKNNLFGLRTALTTALALPLASASFGLSRHSGAAQTATEATGQRTILRDARGANAAGNGNAATTPGQAVGASRGVTAPHRADAAAAGADPSLTAAQEQRRRVAVGYQNGANSRSDVCDATIALAEARVRSAAARNKLTGLAPDLEVIVTQRQQLLGESQIRFRLGAGGTSDVNKAEEAVAEARVRVDLYAVLTARRSAFSERSIRDKSGAASAQEVDKAATALQKAEHAFIESIGD